MTRTTKKLTGEVANELQNIVSTLQREGKMHLATKISQNWHKTLLEYSKGLRAHKPDRPMENIFKKALMMELVRLEYTDKEITAITKYLEKNRILQTAPHISPAGKPRFFFINWLTSLPLSQKDFMPVAMFSGLPFSNKTRPGRLSRKENEINLIPSIMQDELVYRNRIPAKMVEAIKNLPPKLRKLLPEAKEEDSYTTWALKASQNIEKKFLRGKPVFFDFNEVTSNYLLLAINDPKNPISKMLFSKKERDFVIKNFKEMVFFYGPVSKGKDKKHEEMENFYLKDGYLESASQRIELNPETLMKKLGGRLCPGMILGFFIMAFLNGFQCLGSFAQIEYLPIYRARFAKFPFLKKYNINKSSAGELTTGGFPDNIELHVFDLALANISSMALNKYKKNLFGEALLAIGDVLLKQNYSMNLVRK